MSVFADSSALVKLYSDENGYESIRSISTMVVSMLARVEVPAALWRKHRMGELTAEQAAVLTDDFDADYSGTEATPPRLVAVRVTPGILEAAARHCAAHGLRAYDAVQLAAAIAARHADPQCDQLAAFDEQLRRAAATEGFRLVPPAIPGPAPAPMA